MLIGNQLQQGLCQSGNDSANALKQGYFSFIK
jgi:hypothetical protein